MGPMKSVARRGAGGRFVKNGTYLPVVYNNPYQGIDVSPVDPRRAIVRYAPPQARSNSGFRSFNHFWKKSANMVSPKWVNMGAGHPLMPTARLVGVAGLGLMAFSGARTAINRAQNRDYSGALTAGAMAGGAGYLAYHYGLQGGSIRNHLRLAARAGSSIGNYLKQMSGRVRI